MFHNLCIYRMYWKKIKGLLTVGRVHRYQAPQIKALSTTRRRLHAPLPLDALPRPRDPRGCCVMDHGEMAKLASCVSCSITFKLSTYPREGSPGLGAIYHVVLAVSSRNARSGRGNVLCATAARSCRSGGGRVRGCHPTHVHWRAHLHFHKDLDKRGLMATEKPWGI